MTEPSRSSSDQPPSESEASIARRDDGGEILRRRMVRPAQLGRYVLAAFGCVTAGTGAAVWATTGSDVGVALGAFGGVLLALGTAQHALYRRDSAHWPDQALLWNDGLEIILRNGEIRAASWSDPDFAMQLIARRAPPPANREYLLIWLPDSKNPPIELSAEGFDKVKQTAMDRGLELSQERRGSRADATQMFDIRQKAALRMPGLPHASKDLG